MNKEKFTKLANLYLMDELDEKLKVEFENVMMGNDELHKEFEEIKVSHSAFILNRPTEANEQLLVSARNSLMRTIRNEAVRTTPLDKILELLKNIFVTNYKLALSGVAMIVVGLFVGYLLFSTSNVPMISTSNSDNIGDLYQQGTKISNIRFPNRLSEGGQIEITFDAIKPISYKASPDDPMIQRLLATALVTEDNPGLRLRTVNMIADQAKTEAFTLDPKVKDALITALKVDNNPAVRREALIVLMKFPFDEQIRDSFLFVLSNDHNSGLRVEAINALAQLKIQGRSLDNEIINVLNRKAQYDESNFIRLRAASLVKEGI